VFDAQAGLEQDCIVHDAATDESMGSEAAEDTRRPQGTVVTYASQEAGYRDSHERATRIEIARRLAALKGFSFRGEYDASARYPGPMYFVPSNTLLGGEAASLGIRGEHDLFGGVVPHAFTATKAITHPLVSPDAHAPAGWSHEFGRRVQDAALVGFTAFTPEDARRGCAGLLERGPARAKPARASAGRDQTVIFEVAELEAVLDGIEAAELSSYGLVLEENLTEVVTYSVGQVHVAGLVDLTGCFWAGLIERISPNQRSPGCPEVERSVPSRLW
jgi:hypothetical protein